MRITCKKDTILLHFAEKHFAEKYFTKDYFTENQQNPWLLTALYVTKWFHSPTFNYWRDSLLFIAQTTGSVEHTDCISAEGKEPRPTSVLDMMAILHSWSLGWLAAWLVGRLGFYGISTLVDYLMSNPLYAYYIRFVVSKVRDLSRGRPEDSFFNSYYTYIGTLAQRLECSPMARETWVQSQVESYQRL